MYKSSVMYVMLEQKAKLNYKSSLLFRPPNLHKTQCCAFGLVRSCLILLNCF